MLAVVPDIAGCAQNPDILATVVDRFGIMSVVNTIVVSGGSSRDF